MVAYTYDQIADYLTTGYWGGTARSFNVSSGGNLSVNISALSNVAQQFATAALQVWSDATGITFTPTLFAGADIVFEEPATGGEAWSSSLVGGGTIFSSTVSITADWLTGDYTGNTNTGVANLDSYSFQTYIHEIGHALGLGHAGSYNGAATYGTDNHYDNDSWQATVMSYFSQNENWNITASYAYVLTPQIADLIAIQDLYGVPTDTRLGDTTYGYNSNIGGWMDGVVNFTNPVTFTIIDSGGVDTLDLSGVTVTQNIDLRPESISDIFGLTGNMMIARGTIIENYIGGSGVDNVRGNIAQNNLQGGNGNDILLGRGGNDTISGGPGHDTLKGGRGDDTINGGTGNDDISGGMGNDILNGDGGNDKIRGAEGNDTINGGAGVDHMWGGTGIDTFTGGADADLFIFKSGAHGDFITDFEDNIDKIKIRGFVAGDITISADAAAGAGHFDVTFGAGNLINVYVQGAGTLAIDDFIFV